MKKIVSLLGFVLALLGAAAQASPEPRIGAPAPPIVARGLDGKGITLAQYRGKVLVLNFWATWCPPCRAETPNLIKAAHILGGPGVVFLGVDSTEAAPIIRSFLAAKGLPYQVAIDTDETTVDNYHLSTIPRTFVIDANGIVRGRFDDVISVDGLAALVKAAKAGRNGVMAASTQSTNQPSAAAQNDVTPPTFKNPDAPSTAPLSEAEQKNWRDQIAAFEQTVALDPDPYTYLSIGRAYLLLKDYPNATASDRKAVELAVADYTKQKTEKTIDRAARTWLYLGRAYVEAGDPANAHAAFENVVKYGAQLPPKSADFAKFTEEGQEADVALSLSNNAQTIVSLAPWTGADLPGSVSSTLKYRLVLASRPGSSVTLRAIGLAKGWLASFCSDTICAPMRRSVVLPSSGVKMFEFQLIKTDPAGAPHTTAQVQASGSSATALSSTVTAP